MSSIADSDAFLNPERMLAQHQAALLILQGILADTKIHELHWLDLASGRGQIIANLDKNISDTLRKKIRYCGYDIDNEHSRSAARLAAKMGLASSEFVIGELSRVSSQLPPQHTYDFITLTNTIHEINPHRLAEILLCCIERLAPTGRLYIYDMDRLPTPELGAVLWQASEIRSILSALVQSLGCSGYEPPVGQWKHKECNGWNAQIWREHLVFADPIEAKRGEIVAATAAWVKKLLERKLKQTRQALESLTLFGAETGDEANAKEEFLYDFWALMRAMEDAS